VLEGNLTELIDKDGGAIERDSVTDCVSAGVEESETAKVTEVLPLEVGSPETAPLLPRLSPWGSALDDQV